MKSENKKKKEGKETPVEVTGVKKENIAFDFEEAIRNYECPEMLKAGFRTYVKSNNLTIKSEKEFEKIITDFENFNIGG